jgi:hypothetical protein
MRGTCDLRPLKRGVGLREVSPYRGWTIVPQQVVNFSDKKKGHDSEKIRLVTCFVDNKVAVQWTWGHLHKNLMFKLNTLCFTFWLEILPLLWFKTLLSMLPRGRNWDYTWQVGKHSRIA